MQFFEDTPFGGKDFSMSRIIEQLGQGLVGEMQQRRQRLNQQRAIGGIDPTLSDQRAEDLSYMDPRSFQGWVKEAQRQPMYRAQAQRINQLEGLGQPQQQSPLANLQQKLSSPGSTMPMGSAMGQQQAQPQQQMQEQSQAPFEMLTPDMAAQEQKAFFKKKDLEEQKKNRALKRELATDKSIQANWKEAAVENKDLNESIASSEKFEKDLDDLINLNQTGQLIQGKEHIALKALGLDKFFTNDITQLASKDIERMGSELLRQVRTGGKVTDFIFQSLKATLPSLVNTKSGLNAIAKTVKIETVLDRKYKEMKRKVKGEYQRSGLPVPMLTIDGEVKARMKPFEDRMNRDRMKIIGNTIVNAIPTIKTEAQKLKSGTQKRFNGILLQKEGNDWFIVPEENLS